MKKYLLILILIAAFLLRFWHLTSLPYPPDGDEVAFGYYGWSILHYGTDEYGTHFPLSFSSVGDFKYPGLVYLNAIVAIFFGLSNLTPRLLSAVSGVLLVGLVYYLARLLFKDRLVATISACFAAISPWAIIESRLGYESMVSTVLTTLGLIILLKLLRKDKFSHPRIIWAGVFLLFLISSFTYAAPRIFIPSILFVIFIFSYFRNSWFKTQRRNIFILFISITLIIIISLIPAGGRGRAGEDIWKGISGSEKDRLQQLYVGAGTSPIKIPARVTWLFHNKYRIAVFDFFQRYLNHFSPNILFIEGESTLQRIPDMGVLLLVDIVFLSFGVLYILKDDSKHSGKFILSWILLAPVASALTTNMAIMNRASLMIVPLVILSAYGFSTIFNFIKPKHKKAFLFITIGVVFANSLYSLNQIFIQKPLDRPWYKQTVNEALTEEILKIRNKYQAVVTPDDDYIFFLFYGKISPKEFLKNSDIEKSFSVKWERVNRWENIYFKMPFDCPKGGKLNVLYVCKGGDVPQNSKIVKTFYYLDGIPAYSLIEFYPLSQLPSPLPELPKNLHYMVDVEKTPQYIDGIIPGDFSSMW